MMDLAGAEITPEECEMLLHPLVGGVLLFTRNYEHPDQLQDLVRDIHALRDPHLIVAVDHEGGRVQRFRRGFTRLPPVALLGRVYDRDRAHGKDMAEVSGWLMASELRGVGNRVVTQNRVFCNKTAEIYPPRLKFRCSMNKTNSSMASKVARRA